MLVAAAAYFFGLEPALGLAACGWLTGGVRYWAAAADQGRLEEFRVHWSRRFHQELLGTGARARLAPLPPRKR